MEVLSDFFQCKQTSGFDTTNEFTLPKRKKSIVSRRYTSRRRRTQATLFALLLPVTIQCVRSEYETITEPGCVY
jgi:hypothetical protein